MSHIIIRSLLIVLKDIIINEIRRTHFMIMTVIIYSLRQMRFTCTYVRKEKNSLQNF